MDYELLIRLLKQINERVEPNPVNAETMGVTQEKLYEIVKYAKDNKYIENVEVNKVGNGKVLIVKLHYSRLTKLGKQLIGN